MNAEAHRAVVIGAVVIGAVAIGAVAIGGQDPTAALPEVATPAATASTHTWPSLLHVAKRLRLATRPYDTVARLSGDEFASLLDDTAGQVEPQQVAHRIIAEMSQPIALGQVELAVTASIGIAACPPVGVEIDELMRMADTAMYEAKLGGRNRYCVASGTLPAVTPMQRMHNDIRRAVAAREFLLHYQPQLDLNSGQVVGLEALLRWRKPDGSLEMPDKFIPHLEDTGLIAEVGRWALHEACTQLARMETSGARPLRIAVNLSAHQVNAELPAIIQKALHEADVAPGRLELEVTESVLMSDTRAARNALDTLHEMGVRIAIDDFGTGCSSLAYLLHFHVHAVKLDRGFVQTLPSLGRSSIMISAIIGLAHKLDLEVIAEGVETCQQRDFLRAEGCNLAQGYLFARPASIEHYIPAPVRLCC